MGVKGFIFSIEALLAAVFLFGVFLLISDLNELQKGFDPQQKILSQYTDGLISSLQKSGAIKNLMESNDDTLLKNISNSMPPSICTQIEIYNYTPTMPNLYYSYSTPNCTNYWSTPSFQQFSTYINRTNQTNISIFWIKAINYAKE